MSDVCFKDQTPNGAYKTQRVEGYGFKTSDVDSRRVWLGGQPYKTVPLEFVVKKKKKKKKRRRRRRRRRRR